MYLSGKTQQFFTNPQVFGCMFSYRQTGGQNKALDSGCKWMLDNGAFTGNFNLVKWRQSLDRMLPYIENCLGIVVPDVPYNGVETIHMFLKYHEVPRSLGYPVALATQNGMSSDMVPWDKLDVLFIGGDNEHKRGPEGKDLAMRGMELGKHVHVGRVSSLYSIKKFFSWADTWDGTTFVYGTKEDQLKKAENMAAGIIELKLQKLEN